MYVNNAHTSMACSKVGERASQRSVVKMKKFGGIDRRYKFPEKLKMTTIQIRNNTNSDQTTALAELEKL